MHNNIHFSVHTCDLEAREGVKCCACGGTRDSPRACGGDGRNGARRRKAFWKRGEARKTQTNIPLFHNNEWRFYERHPRIIRPFGGVVKRRLSNLKVRGSIPGVFFLASRFCGFFNLKVIEHSVRHVCGWPGRVYEEGKNRKRD